MHSYRIENMLVEERAAQEDQRTALNDALSKAHPAAAPKRDKTRKTAVGNPNPLGLNRAMRRKREREKAK